MDEIGASGAQSVEDVCTDPLCRSFYETVLKKNDIRSIIHMPIAANGTFAGLLNVSASGRTIKWQPEHMMLATMIGQLASLVVERLGKEKVSSNSSNAPNVRSVISGAAKDAARPGIAWPEYERSLPRLSKSLVEVIGSIVAVLDVQPRWEPPRLR